VGQQLTTFLLLRLLFARKDFLVVKAQVVLEDQRLYPLCDKIPDYLWIFVNLLKSSETFEDLEVLDVINLLIWGEDLVDFGNYCIFSNDFNHLYDFLLILQGDCNHTFLVGWSFVNKVDHLIVQTDDFAVSVLEVFHSLLVALDSLSLFLKIEMIQKAVDVSDCFREVLVKGILIQGSESQVFVLDKK